LRVYAAPLADFGGAAAGGAVVVASATEDMEKTIGDFHLFLFVAGLAAATVSAIAVAFLMRRALRPLTQLADAAGEVERTADPRRRLPLPPTDDEVGRLAVTLNEMLSSLERSRELERRFLADASHELRTPLTALRGNVAYLVKHGATPEVLADLENDADRLARLADDLLALSREEAAAAPVAEVRLDELVRDHVDGATDVVVEARSPAIVRGDASALERAIANLVENARKHGPPGGTIVVAVEPADGVVRVSVTDEGEGLRLEESRLAFERFWRRSADTSGSGLGLAIVRATAERHGGRAYAEGSRFTIELPAFRKLSSSASTTVVEETEKGLS
jgi:signal transduction histidine kinase